MYFSDTTLRYALMVLLTLFCFSIYRIISSKRDSISSSISRSKELRGTWIKNKHCRSVKEAEFFLQEALDHLSPSLSLKLGEDEGGKQFASYFSLLRVVLKHARMAFHADDDTRARLQLLAGKEETKYPEAVKEAIRLQEKLTIKFIGIMEEWLKGREARKFLVECHKKFMKDVGKRNLVIGRLNQDLDCVDICDPVSTKQIANTP